MRPIFMLLLCAALAGCAGLSGYRDQSVMIASNVGFDPTRFAGRWYTVARYPNPFEARCAGSIAEYTPRPDGSIVVRNTCLGPDGAEIDQISGQAELVGPGRLSVRLEGVPFAAPLWVLWVDADYRTAVLGQPSGRTGWILNRDPDIPADRLRAAREILDFNGYDLQRLQTVSVP